jgi:ribosomal protein S18 acetylase RimI-like enzyme
VATLRRATVDDAEALTRLRGFMHLAMGDTLTPEWQARCESDFRRRLASDDFVAFLIEDGGEPVACGVGWLEEHMPSPYQLDGRRGHISSMSTHPAHRSKGYGRQVMRALMGWFAERDIPRVDLRATPYGEPLYVSEGFTVLGGSTMAWTRPGVRPGMQSP